MRNLSICLKLQTMKYPLSDGTIIFQKKNSYTPLRAMEHGLSKTVMVLTGETMGASMFHIMTNRSLHISQAYRQIAHRFSDYNTELHHHMRLVRKGTHPELHISGLPV